MQLKIWCLAVVLLAGCAGGGYRNSSEPMSSASANSDARRSAKIRTELAAEYFIQNNMAVALEELANAIRTDPSYAPAYAMRGTVQMKLKENAAAEASFQKALDLAPGDPEISNNFGWFLCQTGREALSFTYFDKAVQNPLYLTPEKSRVNAGLCALQAGDLAKAEEFFEQALRSGRSGWVALLPMARLELKRQRPNEARKRLAELHRQVEPGPESLWLALLVERQLGDRSAEASYAAQLTRRFPDSPEARKWRQGVFE